MQSFYNKSEETNAEHYIGDWLQTTEIGKENPRGQEYMNAWLTANTGTLISWETGIALNGGTKVGNISTEENNPVIATYNNNSILF